MKFISFTSGSCGNCYYLCNDNGQALLIDAGASMRRVRKSLADKGLSLDAVELILVTHEHLDHIRFLGTFCKYGNARVCAPRKLHSVLAGHSFTKDHIAACRCVLEENVWNEVGSFSIRWFNVPHDASQTVGYAIKADDRLFVLMTDLRNVPAEAMELAKQADTVVIESNYDYDMLLDGPYPPELKQRILDEGHLGNAACAEAIKCFWHDGLKNIFLCHLSGNNNTPAKAYESALSALEELGVGQGTVHLRTLERGKESPLVNL
ncbi:MAG: MBL fold metallo-hydrolase [Bacteroidales bacterium]|nr:MBL fold metallo-hydrolase [Bacteroidales bacterium]